MNAVAGRGRSVWIAVLVAGLFVAAAAQRWMRQSEWRTYDEEIERLRAAGIPTSVDEMERAMSPGALARGDEFAASMDDLEAALIHAEGEWSWWSAPGPWNVNAQDDWPNGETPDRMAKCREFLAAAQPYVDRATAALSGGPVAFREARDEPGKPTSDCRTQLLRATRLLDARAVAATAAADRLASIEALVRMGNVVEGPDYVAVAVAWGSARKGVRRALDEVATGASSAATVRARLDPLLVPRPVAVLQVSSRAVLAYFCAEGTRWRSGGDRPGTVRSGTQPNAWDRARSWFGADVARSNAIVTAMLPAWTPDEFAEVLARHRRLAEIDETAPTAIRAEIAPLRTWLSEPPITDVWSDADVPVRLRATHVAALDLARIALAVRERRDTTGAWPASFDEVRDMFPGGEIPLDPYTDRPFEYGLTGDRVRLASAGRFDGDDAPTPASLVEEGLVWEWPR